MIRHSLPLPLGLAILCAGPWLPGAGNVRGEPGGRPVPCEAEHWVLPAEADRHSEEPRLLPEVEARPLTVPVAMSAFENQQMAPLDSDAGELNETSHEEEYFTLDELQLGMMKPAWAEGYFRIVPYGYLWGNVAFATEKSFPGSYTLYVQSVDTHGDIDFHRWFIEQSEPRVLLGRAYWAVNRDTVRLLAGETWGVLSPRYPGVLMDSAGWGSGGVGHSRPPLRAKRYLAFFDVPLLAEQGSPNAALRIPISDRFGLQGKCFIGENEGPYLDGVLQGTDGGTRRDASLRSRMTLQRP